MRELKPKGFLGAFVMGVFAAFAGYGEGARSSECEQLTAQQCAGFILQKLKEPKYQQNPMATLTLAEQWNRKYVRIPAHAGTRFRRMPGWRSGPCRQVFRRMPGR